MLFSYSVGILSATYHPLKLSTIKIAGNTMDLASIIFPHYTRSLADLDTKNHDFAHYTSAEVAASIIKNRQIWLRNATLMNDYREIDYGLEILKNSLESEAGKLFKAALNLVEPDIAEGLLHSHFDIMKLVKTEIFMTCISEHLHSENQLGRLSMWRAYGGANGVALILKRKTVIENPASSGLILSPVAYLRPLEMEAELNILADLITKNVPALRLENKEFLYKQIYRALLFSVVCTKHPGFSEEREWRLVYNKSFGSGPGVKHDIVTVRGTPQRLIKFELAPESYYGHELVRLTDLIAKVIIGPCTYPEETAQAFRELLYEAGFESPIDMVEVSSIPLRQ